MLEKHIEGKVCDHAKKCGCLVYKFTSPARRSVPDRMFITKDGVVFFIEFKAPGRKPTVSQSSEIERLSNQGVPVFIIDSIEEGYNVINSFVTKVATL